jgi:hypothetical protein
LLGGRLTRGRSQRFVRQCGYAFYFRQRKVGVLAAGLLNFSFLRGSLACWGRLQWDENFDIDAEYFLTILKD